MKSKQPTTTAVLFSLELFAVGSVDYPGIRQFELWGQSSPGSGKVFFPDFAALTSTWRLPDCTHTPRGTTAASRNDPAALRYISQRGTFSYLGMLGNEDSAN